MLTMKLATLFQTFVCKLIIGVFHILSHICFIVLPSSWQNIIICIIYLKYLWLLIAISLNQILYSISFVWAYLERMKSCAWKTNRLYLHMLSIPSWCDYLISLYLNTYTRQNSTTFSKTCGNSPNVMAHPIISIISIMLSWQGAERCRKI